MNISPLFLQEFSEGAIAPRMAKIAKPFLPGGRLRGEVPPPTPLIFTEEQLKAAERDAYKKGFLEGTADGRGQQDSENADTDRKLVVMTETFAASVAPLLKDYHETLLQFKEDVPKVAMAIARKVAGQALAENAASVVEDTAMRCIETMIGEPKLTITVNTALTGRMEKRLQQLADHLRSASEIVVLGDADMPIDDCRIEWKHGSFARHTGQLWQEIDRVVETMVASGRHDTNLHMEAIAAQVTEANEQPTTKE